MGVQAKPIPRSKPRERWLSTTDRLAPVLMMAPAAIFTVLMIGFPFVYAGYLSLHKITLGSPDPAVFIGLDNFAKAMGDPIFWTAVRVNLALYAVGLILELVLGTYIGILLGQPLRGIAIARVLAIFPAVIPSVAVGLVFAQMFDPAQGLFNFVLRALGQRPQAWLASPTTVLQSILIVEVWQWTPFIALIIMGAMQTLPTEPYEAARIDGASGLQILRYLTLPMLRPAIVVAAMLRTVDLMRIFDSIYIMTQGGPINSSMSLNVYAFTQGFLFSQFGYSSAIMLVLLALTVIASATLGAARRRSGV